MEMVETRHFDTDGTELSPDQIRPDLSNVGAVMITKSWPRPSPRDLIDWLGLFVAPQCVTEDQTRMYMAVRDAVVQHYGMQQGAVDGG